MKVRDLVSLVLDWSVVVKLTDFAFLFVLINYLINNLYLFILGWLDNN